MAHSLHDQLESLDRDIARGIDDALRGPPLATVQVSQLGPAPVRFRWQDGEKFHGGFGPTDLLTVDYWTLRARSVQLFETNLYARGIIRRFVTNIINTGLHLEAVPDESLLGRDEDALADWAEHVENRFRVWEKHPWLCDQRERSTFGGLQADAFREALIAGDELVVLRQDRRTGLPRLQLINGAAVQSPFGVTPSLPKGHRLVHGVELDAQGRHVAFWVRIPDPSSSHGSISKRLPAWGEKSGRRLAWLVYGTDKRHDDVRGQPLLSLVLQSLREIDRYRDSTQRKAVINSMIAAFISKTQDKPGTRPITAGAVRRDTTTTDSGTSEARSFHTAEHIPGLVLDELQQGEEPKVFQTQGTIENFGVFEEAIVQGFSWALETPPEIIRLSFNSNYSASQAAINEYKMFLNKERTRWGEEFCTPTYEEWLVSEVLTGKVSAPGLLEAWRDIAQYDRFGAWVASDWAGQIKPAVDLSKLVRGYREMVAEGAITRDRMSRELTGMKFSKVVKRLRIENEQLAEALAPLTPQEASADRVTAPRVAPPETGDGDEDEDEDEEAAA